MAQFIWEDGDIRAYSVEGPAVFIAGSGYLLHLLPGLKDFYIRCM